MVILYIIMSIWSIMGVEFFREDFPDYFGHFGRAMLTMYQLATFDGWVSSVTRPICLYYSHQPLTVLFFVSYEFMSAVIMLNVVIAILVGTFQNATAEVKEDSAREKML